jgi:predicted TIM-barrel fold metal-dependent hydrolase
MDIFDSHVHVYPGMVLEEVTRPMDTLGIKWSILLGVDHGLDGERRGTNVPDQFIVDFVKQAPDRLIGFGSIHPDRGSRAVALADEIMNVHHLKGIKVYPHSGFYPNDPVMMDVYKRIEELHGIVIMHTGIKALPHQRMIFNRPLAVDEIAVACPDLPIVICHAGYPWVDEALFVSRLNLNVWIDLTFLETLENVTGKEITWSVLKEIKTMMGCDRVIWGSEGVALGLDMYPDAGIERMRSSIRKILDAPFLTGSEKEAILCRNARRLFGV